MSENEHVEVETLELKAEDHASPAAESAAHAFEHTAHAAEGVKEKFHELKGHAVAMAASVIGVGFGFQQLAEKAWDANKTLGMVTKGIAQVQYGFQNWAKGVSSIDKVKHSFKEAHEVVEGLEETEMRLAMPLEELAQVYRSVAGPAFSRLNMNQEQVLALTNKSAEAARTFGISGEQAAMTITRALMGRLPRGFDPFSIKVREAIGNMHKLTSAQAFARLQKGLGDMTTSANAMAQGLGPSIERIHIFFERTLRDVGAPVFKHIVDLIGQWQKKLEGTKGGMKAIAEEWGQKIVTVFQNVEKSVTAIAENWKVLAALWAASKVPKWLEGMQGLASMLGGGAGKTVGSLGAAWKGFSGAGSFGGVAGNLASAFAAASGPIASLAPAAILAAQALKGMYDEWQDRKKAAADLGDFFKAIGEVQKTQSLMKRFPQGGSLNGFAFTPESMMSKMHEQAGVAADVLKAKGMFENGAIAAEKFEGIIAAMSDDVRANFVKMMGPTGLSSDASSGQVGLYAAEMMRRYYQENVVAQKAEDKNLHPPKVVAQFGDIYITQDFKDQDPDRVFVAFQDGITRSARDRISSNLRGDAFDQ